MIPAKRTLISILLIVCLLITLFIIYKAFEKNEWNTIASALAVITAVLAIWSSLNLTWHQEDEKLPNLILYLDTKRFKHATSLIIENVGGQAAYKIDIEWTKPLLDHDGNLVKFTDFEKSFDIQILPSKKTHSRFVDATVKLFERYADTNEPLIFEGIVTYSLTKRSKKRIKEDFQVSMEPERKSLQGFNDQTDFYAENKDVTKAIKALNKTVTEILSKMEVKKTND
jgi:hypothetical protein